MRLVKHLAIWIIFAIFTAHGPAEAYYASVFRIKAAKSQDSSDYISQTGFVSDKYNGIVTALHGVVGCDSITAIGENPARTFTDLSITHADIANDLAVISSSSFEMQIKERLKGSARYDQRPLKIQGYPLGIKMQLRTQQVNLGADWMVSLYKLFPATGSEKDIKIISQRRSPSQNASVLVLEAKLEPGHSGAPLINAEQKVVGVCIGGIRGTEISFAVPWSRVDCKPKSWVQADLNRLGTLDVSRLMTALDQAKEDDKPKYPDLKISEDVEYGYIRIRNHGAPMHNATAEFNALVYAIGNKCAVKRYTSAQPTYFYYPPSTGRLFTPKTGVTSEFTTGFPREFDKLVDWFHTLNQLAGSVNGYCLTSVTLRHLVKVNYEGAATGPKTRYFSAKKTWEYYVDPNTHRKIIRKTATDVEIISPDEYRDELRNKQSASLIPPWKVTQENVRQVRKYLRWRSSF